MATSPARVLYAAQNAIVYKTTGGGLYYSLPINSASMEETIPIENVLVFGSLGAAARMQKEPSKAKMSVKTYLITGSANNLDATAISGLVTQALQGVYSTVVVKPNGFSGQGILTNIAIEASTNNFVTLDLTFEGLGTPDRAEVPTGMAYTLYNDSPLAVTSVTPVTSNYVAVGSVSSDIKIGVTTGTCLSSAKFSMDIPNDTISCLGSEITGSQTVVASGNMMVAKPPYKVSLVVEGTSATACDFADFGYITVKLPQPKTVSRSINQAVGNVGQTYNYTVEDVDVEFGNSTLANKQTS